MRQNRKRNTKIFLLVAVVLTTAICGIWLLSAPSRERQAVEDSQEALLQEILQGIYENNLVTLDYHDEYPHIETPTEAADTDTTSADAEPLAAELPTDENLIAYEALYVLEYGEYAAFSFEPLPDGLFPSAIHGIGILTIERIELRLPIAEGVEYDTLRIAPGRVPQTAQIGAKGNAVIAGHRNYAFGSMFNRLGELEIGDIVGFQARNGEEMRFEVFEIAVIEPHDQIAFIQPVNDSIITLYTCTPIRTATHRLIIRAQRIYDGHAHSARSETHY